MKVTLRKDLRRSIIIKLSSPVSVTINSRLTSSALDSLIHPIVRFILNLTLSSTSVAFSLNVLTSPNSNNHFIPDVSVTNSTPFNSFWHHFPPKYADFPSDLLVPFFSSFWNYDITFFSSSMRQMPSVVNINNRFISFLFVFLVN